MSQSQPKIHRYTASLLLGVTGRTNDSRDNYKARYAAKSGVESAVKMNKSRHGRAVSREVTSLPVMLRAKCTYNILPAITPAGRTTVGATTGAETQQHAEPSAL